MPGLDLNQAILAPSDWKSLAVSAPMPLVPPLMTAILPSSLPMKITYLRGLQFR